MRAPCSLLLLALCAFGLAAEPSAANEMQDYRTALLAADQERWGEVVLALERSLARNPTETGSNVRIYGMRFEPYLPHYHLAVAFYRLERFDRALGAAERSLAAGALGGIRRSRLRLYVDVCRQRLGLPLKPPPAIARQSAPPQAPPSSTGGAHRRILEQRLAQTATLLAEAQTLRQRIAAQRGPAALRRRPNFELELTAIDRQLSSARFRQDAARLEGDLGALELATEDAEAAKQLLEEIAATLGR